ncbi:hypothetical protein NIES2098_12960 [Calothrix sp. NIES-2098]|nr:hypothetical protein NIES2098_12960 [Calothrix sp. NIES-2098]
MTANKTSFLLCLTSKFFKYLFLAFAGLAISYVLSTCFGGVTFATSVIPHVLGFLGRCVLILFCLAATTVIIESVR